MIRPASADDASGIAEIWNPIIRDTTITFTTELKTEAALATRLAGMDGQRWLVAESGGDLLGFALYGPFRSGPGYRFTAEHTVILAPGARGQGVGRKLMGALLSHAKAGGVRRMIGAVSGENPAGLAFHRALGFSDSAILPGVGWKFGRPLDLHLMTLDCGAAAP